ncbi:MAG: glycoside hydrolase family 3 protein [Ruminiclostridium sp.]|nr:glycoside hydrolase family 3 protein [Ruminiclostridium sp.]
MKKTASIIAVLAITLSAVSCSNGNNTSVSSVSETEKPAESSSVSLSEAPAETEAPGKTEITFDGPKYLTYASMTPEEITAALTIERKAAQMVMPAIYNVSVDDMKISDYGSILSTVGCIDSDAWAVTVDGFQQAAIDSDSGIPYIYGQDDVHGVNYCKNAVYFPHNIGQGAANDEELAYQVGLITADEAKLCHMLWNYSPCVAQSVDPRWGRTYESYGSDLDTITRLSTAYTKGLIDGGLVACAKHFFADGNVVYGTGERDDIFMLIDRGDAQLNEDETNELLNVYRAQIDVGVQTIMISHSSLNGVKMHENKEYIMKLKNEMGFKGFIASDWGSVQHISGNSFREQVITSVNAGIDMLMETDRFDEVKQIITDAVRSGEISEERINDAVARIIKVKKDAGLFDDPLLKNINTEQTETGSPEYRKVAEKLVEESLVLLKNDNDVLPFRKGTKVYITGPAADNGQAQCGGWTMSWNGAPSKDVPGATTVLEAFTSYADSYGIEIITDENEAGNADVVLLCVGEQSYAEWNGDTKDMELCGALGLSGNRDAINAARALGKPTVTCIIAGRQVILDAADYAGWDSVVMCYLPGSEGKGVSDVLCGCADFTGRLPSPWYSSLDQIRTDECWLEMGYGLDYGDDFVPESEAEYVPDDPTAAVTDTAAEGTNYTAGQYKDGVYVNEYARLKLNVPGNLMYLPSDPAKKEQTVAALTDEKDIAVAKAMIDDACFGNRNEVIDIYFINIRQALPAVFPDKENVTEDEILDYYKNYAKNNAKSVGATVDFKDRETVTVGGNEYLRDISYYNGTETAYEAMCIRKLDDDLLCMLFYSSNDPEKTPEYYISLFEELK